MFNIIGWNQILSSTCSQAGTMGSWTYIWMMVSKKQIATVNQKLPASALSSTMNHETAM